MSEILRFCRSLFLQSLETHYLVDELESGAVIYKKSTEKDSTIVYCLMNYRYDAVPEVFNRDLKYPCNHDCQNPQHHISHHSHHPQFLDIGSFVKTASHSHLTSKIPTPVPKPPRIDFIFLRNFPSNTKENILL
jgi:hypothetical protein